jgi:CBS domain containing-hemolysin-like protein
MTLLITIIAVTMLISAACSLFEATLYSTRVGALQAAIESGTHKNPARVFLKMKENISSPTSAILILNTVANTAGATLAGMVAAAELGAAAMPIVSVCLTLGILFLSEILPKTIGATRWQSFWPHIVYPLRAMEQGLKPLIFVTQKFSNIFTGGAGAPSVTEDEIQASIHLGEQQGELSRNELQLISAVFRFDEMIVRQIIVPRREVVILKKHQPLQEVFDMVREGRHTRYPVCEDSLDDVEGLLHIKDLMASSPEEQRDWTKLVRPVRSVPANMAVSRLLRQMQRTRQHMAVVLDEHGTATGIVTLENVLEQIVGAVQDEFDSEAPEFETQGPDSFIVGGSLSIERMNSKLHLDLYAPGVDTLSGLLTSRLGRLVKVGDVVDLPGVRAEVTEVRDDHPAKVHLTLDKDLRWTSEGSE